MSGAVRLRGRDQLLKAINKFAFNVDEAMDDAIKATAFKVQATATKDIAEQTPSGNKVRRGKNRYHEVSPEGVAPNTDTGRLMGSIQVSHEKGAQLALVGTNLDYGAILETEKNRPWLEPAKEKESKFFGEEVKAAFANQIKKAGK